MLRFDLSKPPHIKLANQEKYLRYYPDNQSQIDVDNTADFNIKNPALAFIVIY